MLSLRIELNHTGEEVKPGTTVSCQAGDGYVIHLSQFTKGVLLHECHLCCFFCSEEKSAANVPMKDLKNIKDDADEEMSGGDDDFSSDSDDSGMSVDDSSDEETSSGDELSDDSEDESDDSEEQTPTPKAAGKKRAIEAVTPSVKKAKVEPSGQKAGDKKGTPYPSKQDTKTPADKSVKTPATDKKSKEKSLKSGSHACKPCSKTFGSESALESHKKAKHGA
nr:unnamed protein product [Digitaria exilis]